MENEVHNLLVKAVEDNINKFEWKHDKLVFEELEFFHSGGTAQNPEFTVRFGNLETYIKNSTLFNLIIVEINNRKEEKLKQQQEQDLEELKKLCKNS